MTPSSYLAKFGINGTCLAEAAADAPPWPPKVRTADHYFDPCPISGRCGVCGVRADVHLIGPIRKAAAK